MVLWYFDEKRAESLEKHWDINVLRKRKNAFKTPCQPVEYQWFWMRFRESGFKTPRKALVKLLFRGAILQSRESLKSIGKATFCEST